jgi:hypothetical protein
VERQRKDAEQGIEHTGTAESDALRGASFTVRQLAARLETPETTVRWPLKKEREMKWITLS